jgi:hypothetical protein|tara:strand:- start:6683 stop:7087 length:405 start_codon:yes stop_codon:yes gene_type:complete
MSAAQYDFSIEQGSSFRLSLVYKDSNGVAIDITNWCARLIWKTNSNLTQTYSSGNLDVSNYKFTIDGPNGKLLLEFPATTTNGFDFTSAKYDLELQSDNDFYSGGGKYTIKLLFGNATIVKRYSKSTTVLGCQS